MKVMLENLTDLDIKILIAFADNNMNVSETSRQMFLSRSATFYHLEKVKNKTELNPLNFFDLIELLKLCGIKI